MIDIRLPNITATDPAAQLSEVRSYLYQMVEQLNWALNTLDTGNFTANGNTAVISNSNGNAGDGGGTMSSEVLENFGSLKSLIIKTSEALNSEIGSLDETIQGVYTDMERQRTEFDGIYYAKSDFGEFLENYKQILSIDPTAINQAYSDIQTLYAEKEKIKEAIISTNANIKTGILYYDDDSVPIYGVEVGQMTEVNGEELFNKFARFTSSRLSFYDANGSEVAYISDYKLYITNAQVLGNLYLGSYILDTTNGIAFIWNG